MKIKILLVNPWIYDFAAYNLWARPLGLLKVAEFLSAFDTDLFLVDCMDSFREGAYGCGKFSHEVVEKPSLLKHVPRSFKRYGMSIHEFISRIKEAMPFDVVLMTSVMSYWYPGVQKAVEIIREICGNVPIILGGIYATLYHEHATEKTGADFIYKGPLDKGILFALYTFGYKLRPKRTPVPYYRLHLFERYPYAPLLTSSGCPYRCPYCASGLLAVGYRRRAPVEVIREISDLYEMGIRNYAFYDDALLMHSPEHIMPILRGVISSGIDAAFHTPNGMHARAVDAELANLMRQAGFATVRLSLETADPSRQEKTGGKVCNEDLERAVRHLRSSGFSRKEVGVYLMYGLPGQQLEEVREGVRFLMGLDVLIHLAEFSPIRGTESWKALVREGLITDDLDPLLTNNTVFSSLYDAYDEGEVTRLKLAVKDFNARSG